MIREIWKNFNVSTILILPLFNSITEGTKKRGSSSIGFPFIQLAIEYGLIDTFLYADNKKKFDGHLYLSFDLDIVNNNLNLTDADYHSLTERIIDSKYFKGLVIKNEIIIFKLEIPPIYHPDIKKIEESKYSKVSIKYKNEVKIKETKVPYKPGKYDEMGSYISLKDFSYAILIKAHNIKDEIEKYLGTKILLDNEFYVKFDKMKEVLDYGKTFNFNSRSNGALEHK